MPARHLVLHLVLGVATSVLGFALIEAFRERRERESGGLVPQPVVPGWERT